MNKNFFKSVGLPFQGVDKATELKLIECLRRYVPPLALKMITQFYGIGCEKLTDAEIAREYKMSRERIRQVRVKHLNRVKKKNVIGDVFAEGSVEKNKT